MAHGFYKQVQRTNKRTHVTTTKLVPVSLREMKEKIKEANKWTDEQYRKNYDIFKNKLRTYEATIAQHGRVEKQSVIDVLYKEAKAKLRYGSDYVPSQKMQYIRGFSAYSITKGRQIAKTERFQRRETERYERKVTERFSGLIEANATARKIAETISDPYKREQALADYANTLHPSKDEQEGVLFPTGEASGSPNKEVDDSFNIDRYL